MLYVLGKSSRSRSSDSEDCFGKSHPRRWLGSSSLFWSKDGNGLPCMVCWWEWPCTWLPRSSTYRRSIWYSWCCSASLGCESCHRRHAPHWTNDKGWVLWQEQTCILTEQLLFMIKNNTFPKDNCYPRAKLLRDSEPSRFALVLGSLGYRQTDGHVFWECGWLWQTF